MEPKCIKLQKNAVEQHYLPDIATPIHLFAMHCSRVTSSWNFPKHKHTRMQEIFYIIKGSMVVHARNQLFNVQSGDLLLFTPMTEHAKRVTSASGCSYFCMHFEVEDRAFNRLVETFNRVHYVSSGSLVKRIQPALSELTEMAVSAHPSVNNMRVLSLCFDIFAGIHEILSQTSNKPNTPFTMEDLAHYIATELQRLVKEPVNIENTTFKREWIQEIAQQYGISAKHCNRVFHRIHGISPRQYLSQIRLEEAKQLLTDPEQPIEQIGITLGYRDAGSFSRQFKRWTGMTPSQYRATLVSTGTR